MAWIDTIPANEWGGDLTALKSSVADPATGRVDNIMAIHSLKPKSLAAHDAVYTSAMAGTRTLRKVERELIALVVSSINECHY